MPPPLTHLQFLVISLLFTGPKTSLQLRQLLKDRKIKISAPALSRLMTRLQWTFQIHREHTIQTTGGASTRTCTFTITDHGLKSWAQTRQFYLDHSPPPSDFVPYSDHRTRTAHLTPEQQNAPLMQKLYNECPSLFHSQR